MKNSKPIREIRKSRKGAIAALTALLLMAILGLVACALDIGWIEMTRTQLQSASDASSLAGATELMPGLGYFKTKTPAQIATAAKPIAVEYAGYNRNAELDGSYVDDDRDIEVGKAAYDSAGCNCWKKTPASANPAYYNYVQVTPRRDQEEARPGDGPAPLFFARILGVGDKSMHATSTAAILAANGFRVTEPNDTADVMPFAFKEDPWEKFLRAEDYYKSHPTLNLNPNNWNTNKNILDSNDPNTNSRNDSLFGDGTIGTNAKQTTFDQYRLSSAGAVTSGADSKLELKIYPNTTGSSGNFGTVDLGSGGNSTNELRRKITEGLNADDLSHYENNELVLSDTNPLDEGANPGLSNGMKSALDAVHGQCKAIALYTTLTGNGNNAVYKLVKFISVAIVYNDKATDVRVQRCVLVDNSAVPDTEHEIDNETTIFTPVTLIR